MNIDTIIILSSTFLCVISLCRLSTSLDILPAVAIASIVTMILTSLTILFLVLICHLLLRKRKITSELHKYH